MMHVENEFLKLSIRIRALGLARLHYIIVMTFVTIIFVHWLSLFLWVFFPAFSGFLLSPILMLNGLLTVMKLNWMRILMDKPGPDLRTLHIHFLISVPEGKPLY